MGFFEFILYISGGLFLIGFFFFVIGAIVVSVHLSKAVDEQRIKEKKKQEEKKKERIAESRKC